MFAFHSTIPKWLGLASLLLLAACQSVPMLPGLSTHRIDIQQGNVLTQEMVDKLKPGMTRQQVRFVLGTPPIVDPFHPDRWDYIYYYKKGGVVQEHRRLVLLFDNETLKRVEGDVVPAAGQSSAANAIKAPENVSKPAAEPAEERGFFGRMLDKIF